MGIGVNPGDPVGYGDDCNACESILWDDGRTPEKIVATFFGVEDCPGKSEAPHDFYILVQLGTPCVFQAVVGQLTINVDFNFNNTTTDVTVFDYNDLDEFGDPALYFWAPHTPDTECSKVVNNRFIEGGCGGGTDYVQAGFGGSVEFSW